MTSKHDYKAALQWLDDAQENLARQLRAVGVPMVAEQVQRHATLSAALRIVHALMQEPSEAMKMSGRKVMREYVSWCADDVFNAMRDQLLKECE